MKLFPVILIVFTVSSNGVKEDSWNLLHEKDEIEVYTREVEGSNLKELKMVFSISNTSVEQITSILMNTDEYPHWVYRCEEAKILEKTGDASLDYYQYDFPWPLSDRELISKSTYHRDTKSGKVTIETRSVTQYPGINSNKDLVRITHHFNQWNYIQNGKNVDFEYYLNSSPGGNIPTWLVNMALDVGSLNTVRELRSKASD